MTQAAHCCRHRGVPGGRQCCWRSWACAALGVGQHRPAVALIGDSITANLESTAKHQLGGYSLTVDGMPGFLADQQVPAVANAARFPFDQMVINLGTNDVMTSDHDLDETVTALGQMADSAAGIRCVHLVTVSEEMVNGTNDAGPRARRLNDAIRSIAAATPQHASDRLGRHRTRLRT